MTVQNAAAPINASQNQLNTTNLILEKKQTAKKVLLQNIADIQQQIAGAQQAYGLYSSALAGLNRTAALANSDIKATLDNLVAGLSLESVTYSGRQINISGKAVAEPPVLAYVRNLTATEKFAEITISTIKIDSSDNVTPVEYVSAV